MRDVAVVAPVVGVGIGGVVPSNVAASEAVASLSEAVEAVAGVRPAEDGVVVFGAWCCW